MKGDNPCNICSQKICEGCILQRFNRKSTCKAYYCMLNYEGSCLVDLYDDCGCRMIYDGEVLTEGESTVEAD